MLIKESECLSHGNHDNPAHSGAKRTVTALEVEVPECEGAGELHG